MPESSNEIRRAVDRCIHGLAVSLVEKHGPEAPAEARRKAKRLEAVGDRQASAVWQWIHQAAVSVLKDGSDPGRSVH